MSLPVATAWGFQWPEWVPQEVRGQIEDFWRYHNYDQGWLESATRNQAPEMGSIVSLPKLSSDELCRPGRFVFAWNNIGRVVHPDGTFDYVSIDQPDPEGKQVIQPEQQLQNLAQIVLEYTEVKRSHNGRGRSKTYAANVDAIADASRQLAEMVQAFLNGKLEPVEYASDNPFRHL